MTKIASYAMNRSDTSAVSIVHKKRDVFDIKYYNVCTNERMKINLQNTEMVLK